MFPCQLDKDPCQPFKIPGQLDTDPCQLDKDSWPTRQGFHVNLTRIAVNLTRILVKLTRSFWENATLGQASGEAKPLEGVKPPGGQASWFCFCCRDRVCDAVAGVPTQAALSKHCGCGAWAARKSVLLKMHSSKTASKHGAMVLHGQVPWATAVDWHPRALWLAGLFGRPPGAESGCQRFCVVY